MAGSTVGPFWPICVGKRETARVDELVVPESGARIAGQHRAQLDIGRPQQRHVADVEVGARDLGAVQVHAEVTLLLMLKPERLAPLCHLRDAGELPAVEEAAGDLVP